MGRVDQYLSGFGGGGVSVYRRTAELRNARACALECQARAC